VCVFVARSARLEEEHVLFSAEGEEVELEIQRLVTAAKADTSWNK